MRHLRRRVHRNNRRYKRKFFSLKRRKVDRYFCNSLKIINLLFYILSDSLYTCIDIIKLSSWILITKSSNNTRMLVKYSLFIYLFLIPALCLRMALDLHSTCLQYMLSHIYTIIITNNLSYYYLSY